MIEPETPEDLSGAFVDGYTPEDVDRVSALVWRRYGLVLVAVWDRCDRFGPVGDSVLGVVEAGQVRGCDALTAWLEGTGPAPNYPLLDGVVGTHAELAWGPGFNLYWSAR